MTSRRRWLLAWTAACLAVPVPGAAQAQAPKPPPVAVTPAEKADKAAPARRLRAPPPKAGEERPRPDVAVSFPADI
jgi:hypothetical protein